MNSKITLFIVGVGLPFGYFLGRDIIYDATAKYLGDNRRLRKRQIELQKEKERILNEAKTLQNNEEDSIN